MCVNVMCTVRLAPLQGPKVWQGFSSVLPKKAVHDDPKQCLATGESQAWTAAPGLNGCANGCEYPKSQCVRPKTSKRQTPHVVRLVSTAVVRTGSFVDWLLAVNLCLCASIKRDAGLNELSTLATH
jgi:hypothetical protein